MLRVGETSSAVLRLKQQDSIRHSPAIKSDQFMWVTHVGPRLLSDDTCRVGFVCAPLWSRGQRMVNDDDDDDSGCSCCLFRHWTSTFLPSPSETTPPVIFETMVRRYSCETGRGGLSKTASGCQTPAAVTWHSTCCLFTCAAGCWRLLCSAASSSGAGWGSVREPRPDRVAPSRPFTPFRPTPGRTPRTGRPGWTGASPWLAGTRPGPCACCQWSCSWARHPHGTPGRRQSSGRTERLSAPAGVRRIWKIS